MEQQTPIPPKSGMKPREGQKRAIFQSLIGRGGRRGGLGFPFILSKIVVYAIWFHEPARDKKCSDKNVKKT